MPVKQGMSPLARKLAALDGAVKKHANDPTEMGRVDLPPGIKNGVARVVKCYFGEVAQGKQNAGELFFRAEAVVVEPEFLKVDGRDMKVRGLRTSIMEMVCDTTTKGTPPKTTSKAEHVANVLNELRKMGVSTNDLEKGADLEVVCEQVTQAKPYINFSTSPRYDMNDRTKVTGAWENWNGTEGLEDYVEGGGDGVQDETGGTTDDAGEPTADDMDPPPPAADADGPDLDSLAERADGGDADAIGELVNLAEAGGIDTADGSDWANSASYADAVELIKAAGTDAQTEEPEPTFEPEKGKVYSFHPVVKDAKGKETIAKKAVEVQVTAVYKKSETVDLKNLTNPKLVYKGVAWDKLVH